MNQAIEPAAGEKSQPQKRSRLGNVLLFGIIAVVGIIFLVVFYIGILNPPSQRVSEGLAPEITFTTYDGQQMRLSELRGKPVVINFWASWCVPCREEQAILEETWQRHKGDVMFLGLDYLDQEPNALAYLAEFGVTYPNGPDKGSRAYTTYHVQGVPETFFVDAEGRLHGYYVGPIPASELERRIQELLTTES
ncbi:MAG: TlpA family protein disulfide reductase [Caldilineales bacterium]|nr:TlpA family protein disulfide reductase [Caldilineales bacterium]